MLLEDRNAIIYGGGGGLGSVVARTFAREGARVYLAGRTQEPLDRVAGEIRASGGVAEAAALDALDADAVDRHAQAVASAAGSIDVSLNLMKRGDVQGVPLVDMNTEQLTRAVVAGLSGNFHTARAAARQMITQGSGVILHLTSGSGSGGHPMMGSTSPADAATESFMRSLAAEVGPGGVRVVGIWTAGVAETLRAAPEKLGEVNANLAGLGADAAEQIIQGIANATMLRRAPSVTEVAEAAAFLASDKASGMTGTITNVTCGLVPG